MPNEKLWPKGWPELYPGEFDYLQLLCLLPPAYSQYEIKRARRFLRAMTSEEIKQAEIEGAKYNTDMMIAFFFQDAGLSKREYE